MLFSYSVKKIKNEMAFRILKKNLSFYKLINKKIFFLACKVNFNALPCF